ncbi:peptidylprolyl isomerase [Telmatospirillum sp. J64-1]|uniref:peptidylprolyl isomerase n=1 Tax=Telmatospirillum sp. J64-1 TaxID=2502183 RepID=UPI00115D9296|nr:peptidylprolyl isomerase [Telmatospirillum sp. J64-1]
MKALLRAAVTALTAAFLFAAPAAAVEITDPENTLLMELKTGTVVIEMRPDLAPQHVERIKTLTRQGFYDGTPFHRVIRGFMAQGGDPTGTGMGGSELPDLPAEFSNERHIRGIASMARSANPNSANSQFFIMLGSAPSLDGQYTIWGRVIDGMPHVDAIRKGNPQANGIVSNPDRIISMRVAADVQEKTQ